MMIGITLYYSLLSCLCVLYIPKIKSVKKNQIVLLLRLIANHNLEVNSMIDMSKVWWMDELIADEWMVESMALCVCIYFSSP